MAILVVGSVAFDTLRTPSQNVDDVIGGAATHFALAASFFSEVKIVAVVGSDFTEKERKVFEGRDIDLEGLKSVEGKTFRWGGEYSADLAERTTLFTELNVFESFQPELPAGYRDTEHVFLANIHPDLQVDVVGQVNEPRLIGADTMNYWIERTPDSLAEMLKRIHVLVINDEEARQLAEDHNLVRAASRIREMGPKTIVIKRGEHGVLCFRGEERFATVSFPLETVVDPTGAGDSFAGGFMGYLASRAAGEVDSQMTLRRAIIFGSVMGSFCVEDLGTRRLERLSREEVHARYGEFKDLTHFEAL